MWKESLGRQADRGEGRRLEHQVFEASGQTLGPHKLESCATCLVSLALFLTAGREDRGGQAWVLGRASSGSGQGLSQLCS